MSGPKCIEYDVARLAAVRAAALAQLRADARELRQRELALVSRVEAAVQDGVPAAEPLRLDLEVGDDPAAAEARLRSSRERLSRAESALVSQLAAQRAQRAVASLAALGGGAAILAVPRIEAAATASSVAPDTRAERIERVLGYLPPVIPDHLRYQVVSAAEAAATGGPQHLDELRVLVDRCLTAATDATRARTLLDGALGLTSPVVVPVLAALLEVETGRATAGEEEWSHWTSVLETARLESDRTYVLETTAAVMADLGYAVGEEFVTDPDVSSTIATREGWSEHGVQLRAPRTDGVLNVNVVREGLDDSGDVQAEERFCTDLDAVRAAWKAVGIDSTLRHASPAGSVDVQPVAALPEVKRRAAGRRRASASLKAKERPL